MASNSQLLQGPHGYGQARLAVSPAQPAPLCWAVLAPEPSRGWPSLCQARILVSLLPGPASSPFLWQVLISNKYLVPQTLSQLLLQENSACEERH